MRTREDIVGGKGVRERLAECWRVMEETAGREIPAKGRQRDLVNLRGMIFTRLWKDGFSLSAIGRAAGFNHSTVWNAREVVKTIIDYPHAFPDEARIWEEFNQKITKI